MVEPTGLRHVHAALAGSSEFPTWPEDPLLTALGCSCCGGSCANTAWIRGMLSHHPDMTHTKTEKCGPTQRSAEQVLLSRLLIKNVTVNCSGRLEALHWPAHTPDSCLCWCLIGNTQVLDVRRSLTLQCARVCALLQALICFTAEDCLYGHPSLREHYGT